MEGRIHDGEVRMKKKLCARNLFRGFQNLFFPSPSPRIFFSLSFPPTSTFSFYASAPRNKPTIHFDLLVFGVEGLEG